uniref:CACTA en-spm transposon protein n=1 Tax=Cucumis melo TaxID=3656 RepID=A0A9I9EG35_CUCME
MNVGNPSFPDAFLGISRRCATVLGNPLYNRFNSVKYKTETERGKGRGEPLPSSVVIVVAAFRCRRCRPSPPSATLGFRVYDLELISKLNAGGTDDMFLEFEDDLDNIAEGSSSMGDNSSESKNFLHFNLRLFHDLLLNNMRLRLIGDVHSLDSWS